MSSEGKADSSPLQKKLIARFATYLLFAIFIIGGIFLFRDVRNTHLKNSCQRRLSTLAEAIHEYHDSHDAFPPVAGPITPDTITPSLLPEEGTETNNWSWRVRVLPYLGEKELYDKFHFDEPWDSEHNLTVAQRMPHFFQCPAEESGVKKINGQEVPVTNYVMVTGPKTIGSTDDRIVCFEDVMDPTNMTLLLVEVEGKNRPVWTEPRDITLEELAQGINSESGMSVGSSHHGGTNVCFADSSTWFIESDYCSENPISISHNTDQTWPSYSKTYDNIGDVFVTLAIYDDNFIPPLP